MNLALLLPAGLAALAALLVPLVLHLARRSERRPLDFAALRWLSPRARPRRHVRFDEIPLLVLRLVLLAALAVLLARPVLEDAVDGTPWVVAVPGVDAAAIDAAATDGARRHWLAPGFPSIEAAPPPAPLDTASLLRELDVRVPAAAPLTILVPPVLDGADAERPRLSREVDWRVVPAAERAPVRGEAAPLPRLAVRHHEEHAAGVRYLRAVALAWHAAAVAPRADAAAEAAGGDAPAAVSAAPRTDAAEGAAPDAGPAPAPPDVAPLSTPVGDETDVVAWLAADPVPETLAEWTRAGGTLLLDAAAKLPRGAAPGTAGEQPTGATPGTAAMRDHEGRVLLRGYRLGQGRVLQWTAPLAPAAMPALLEPDFAARLRAALMPDPAPARVDARHYAPEAGAEPWPVAPRPLAPWLALLVAALFLLERWWANSPRRGARQ